jgi:methionine-rich copper-binding protein CopC
MAASMAIALLAVPAVAAAHAPLESSSPEAGARLDTAPNEVTLTFGGELDPDGSSFRVTGANGDVAGRGELDLSVADRNVMSGEVTIGDPGIYTVHWTSKSIDGAVLKGTFSFGFDTDDSVPAATGGEDEDHDAPDTALRSPRNAPTNGIVGLLLIAAALGVTLRRAVVR